MQQVADVAGLQSGAHADFGVGKVFVKFQPDNFAAAFVQRGEAQAHKANALHANDLRVGERNRITRIGLIRLMGLINDGSKWNILRGVFRVVEFSVQDDHLHLIVEADDNDALERGMKSFSVRANRLFNAASGRRRGRVWGDRYHRRDLTGARQVRNALVYCLSNYKKHFGITSGTPRIDVCSSARWFRGWTAVRQHDDGPRPTEEARTALLSTAWWKKHGHIHPGEAPRAPN